jgi:hypothetical protein
VRVTKGVAKHCFTSRAKNSYQLSIRWDRIREDLGQAVERARKGEKRSPVRMWEKWR